MVLTPSTLVTGWHQLGIKGAGQALYPSPTSTVLQANPKKMREPTSGLEPLPCSSYECALRRFWALHSIANTA